MGGGGGRESFCQLNHANMEDHHHKHEVLASTGWQLQHHAVDHFPAMPPAERQHHPPPPAESPVMKFPITSVSGETDLGKDVKLHEDSTPFQEYQGHFELTLGQSMVCKFCNSDGVYSPYGAQTMVGKMLLPPAIATDVGPIYVNAKKFDAIIRRRLARAKAEGQHSVSRSRKPYLHESRHLHAMRRARSSSGRFLSAKNASASDDHGASGGGPWSADASNKSSSASEATRVYPAHEVDMCGDGDFRHAIGHIRSPAFFPSLAAMVDGGEGKWASVTPHGCCVDLFKA